MFKIIRSTKKHPWGRIVRHADVPYSFDSDGYMIKGLHADNCRYSAQGELLGAEAWSGPITYSYDALGRRVARSDRSGTYQYFYANPDSPFQLSAARGTSGVFSAYYYDPSGALFAFKRGSSTYYVATDHLGSPCIVTDATGAVTRTTQYDSYGQVLLDSNTTFDLPVGFAGGITDNTGLTRFGFRDYEPATGRWVSRDPILYQSGQANLYQYVENNPIDATDPLGLMSFNCGSGFLSLVIPDSWFGKYSFSDACESHDKCYDTPKKPKNTCDDIFGRDIKNECSKLSGLWKINCESIGASYVEVVRNLGNGAYCSAQKNATK